MFDFQRQIRLRQAENAFRDGRLDEAFAIANEQEIRELRGGQMLLEQLVDPLLSRGREHFSGGRLKEALLDIERAIVAGGNRPSAAQLRQEVETALHSRERRHRQERETLEAARAHLANGSLRAGLSVLDGAPQGSTEADRLRREVERREARAKEARARAVAYLEHSDPLEALRALEEAVREDPRNLELPDLKVRARKLATQRAEQALVEGDFSAAGALLRNMDRSLGPGLETRRLQGILDLAIDTSKLAARNELAAAAVVAGRLARELPGATWARESLEALQQAASGLAALRAGPLGRVLEDPAGTGSPGARGEPTRAGKVDMGTLQDSRTETPTSERWLLWVDGVGTYLVLKENRVSFGRSGSSAHPDIALPAEIAGFHAEINRTDDDYFVVASQGKVEVGGQVVTRRLLTNGDTILLGGLVKVLFELPTPLSPSAVLTLKNHRIPGDVRKVVLLKDHFLIGPGEECHVGAPPKASAESSAVLSLVGGRLHCRAETEILLDGQPAGKEAQIPPGCHVQIGDVTFTITDTARVQPA